MTSPSNKPKPDQTEADFTKDPVALLVTGAFLGVLTLAFIALVMKAMGAEWTFAFWASPATTKADGMPRLHVLQGFILLVGGLATLILAAWRTNAANKQASAANEQVRAAFTAQQIDRAKQIAELLKDESEVSQISGITAAVELARSDPERYYLRMASLIALTIRKHANQDAYKQARSDYSAGVGITILPTVLDTALRELSHLRDQIEGAEELETARDWMCNLKGIWIYRAILWKQNFRYTNFRGARLVDVTFQDCNMNNISCQVDTSFYYSSFVRCEMRNARIQYGAYFRRAHFEDCDLTNSIFAFADLTNAKFFRCNLSAVTFQNRVKIKEGQLALSWCWSDTPPNDDMHGGAYRRSLNVYDAGPDGIYRREYEAAGRNDFPDFTTLLATTKKHWEFRRRGIM